MTFDLENEFSKLKLQTVLKDKIEEASQEMFDDGHRNHLGASLIGHECRRYLWYTFRWIKNIKHSGRLYRLFNRGHREEEAIIKQLKAIGCEVKEFDENGKQFRVSACSGHFGGSMDGIVKLPPEFGIEQEMLLEMKTINQNGHTKLIKHGVESEKPVHFGQTSVYGLLNNFEYCLYVSVNKNDDDIYLEIFKLDKRLGRDLIDKAEGIINSQTPPSKCSKDPTFFICKFCNFNTVCHEGEEGDVNCRSCKFAEPCDGAVWQCTKFGEIIPKEEIAKKQDCWESILK